MDANFDQRNWYGVNFNRLKELFADATFDHRLCSWFKIARFPLPKYWRQTQTQLLVVLPGLNGDIRVQTPNEFYINKGLCTVSGRKPEHYFEQGGGFNAKAHKGWARYSWHFSSWDPTADVVSGDNLVTLLEVLYLSLGVLAEEAEGRR